MVLVLEVAGAVANFVRATERIPGLEWIGEWSAPDLPASADFYTDREGEPIGASLFLLFSNQSAMREMLRLWQTYLRGESLPRGLAPWKHVFSQLHDIRVWSESDRITPELRADWRMRLESGAESVPFELELWFYHQSAKRDAAANSVRTAIEEAGGSVSRVTVIEEIEWHALIGVIPARAVRDVRDLTDVRVFRSGDIMFARPVAQAFVSAPEPEELITTGAHAKPLPEPGLAPIVALLDGLPIANHPVLDGRLIVDDPDGWEAAIPVAARFHGTAMASLIVHGDLSENEDPLDRPLYVRPILKPEGPDWLALRREAVPEDTSFVDIVHRAIRRIFDEDTLRDGRIYIVNLSVGDRARMFDRTMSPCARLLDWLAWKYQVVILVSAGNHAQDLDLGIPRHSMSSRPADELEGELLRSIDRDGINRRLLSPAEAINCITVGAVYQDGSTGGQIANSLEAYTRPLPSPYNAQGFGYRRAVKPDVLAPGGRLLLREKLPNPQANAVAQMLTDVTRRPGQCIATPPRGALAPSASYTRGTSNATAIATRTAARIYAMLSDAGKITAPIPDEYMAVAIKTSLVHGASWRDLGAHYEAALQIDPRINKRDYIAKYLGNGVIDVERSIACSSRRVTVFGYGLLPDGAADVFEFPLPDALSGQRVLRELTITLSWITPTNLRHYNYRRAHLWFSFSDPNARPSLIVPSNRTDVHAIASMRGTIQHEVFRGDDSRVYRNADSIRVWVNCRADAGALEDPVPYCLAVSLEIPNDVNLPIYQEVATRIRQQVGVRARVVPGTL